MNKDDSEKDSDSPESPPDSMETQEVVQARENLVSLMAEQKRIRKQKASLPVSVSIKAGMARRPENCLSSTILVYIGFSCKESG